MKHIAHLLIICASIVLINCSSKTEHSDHDPNQSDESAADANEALYDEVMKIHDEVMPKMNDIYKMKEELKKQIADAPNMVDEKREELEAKIANLEEASRSMMEWMREFNPPADSLGEETVREYLEGQLESVKKVRETINSATGTNK